MIRAFLVATLLVSTLIASIAQAQSRSGTADEQKACSKDVSRYCRAIMDQSDLVILSCLQQNRAKISKACDAVLISHGQ